ncbi:3,4-dihydroxy-2-butanone-4-phosphate synthase [Maritimibacter dapengensis]|uniref:3,4-dihydroxy-2-butanone 4-phosphate synthase n=1 Tax=Maritimibacter dapengensis TaxID=2836868 RepID=A0ABS6T3X1_9RHOB|nr:3,4-dihydroxy-2-butanone-4-phosphate synthase [Maritimibacter dapengensis]MBV7379942.1 3,4-dihydroxy-2-butanone-4-phosphate synthase [Maritimibacter dapengensis]
MYMGTDTFSPLASAEEIIEEARKGRMFVLVDDEDRENEGDLVIPAAKATPEAINFMATHGRGLICLAMTAARCDSLGLAPMPQTHALPFETAFTVSIEARHGVTTGISAADRACTIQAAIDPQNGAEAISSPGHVFPLRARDGGVLVRAGHTEASVDIAKLAGLEPSGVICEIMNDDGTMARLDDLIPFARKHGLKIGTIRDLIEYRLQNDHLVTCTAETEMELEVGGTWTVKSFHDAASGLTHVALQKGQVREGAPTLVRMHHLSIVRDLLGQGDAGSAVLRRAMEQISQAGSGVVVLLVPDGPDEVQAEVRLGRPVAMDARAYGTGAQILAALGVRDMRLLTNTHHEVPGIQGYGLTILEDVKLTAGHGAST